MRLIDADFVCEQIEKEIKDIVIPKCPYAKRKDSEYDIGYNNALTMAKAIAMKAPTIEAEPVRHGEWKEHYANGVWYYDCPFCDDGYATKEQDVTPPNYCQNCGAKMDGKEKEE